MTEELSLCECGCGERVSKAGNRFIHSHNSRGENNPNWKPKSEPKLCECGCGGLASPGKRFIWGHGSRGENHSMYGLLGEDNPNFGRKNTPETLKLMSDSAIGRVIPQLQRDKISDTLTGRKLPRETCDKMAEYQRLNPQTGSDIISHHFVYDHSDPKKYRMDITRSEHTTLHNNMKACGLKVIHINVTDENKDIFKYLA